MLICNMLKYLSAEIVKIFMLHLMQEQSIANIVMIKKQGHWLGNKNIEIKNSYKTIDVLQKL